MNGETDLQKRFPYMFREPNSGIDLYCGWLSILRTLCEAIDEILGPEKSGFHFRQIKEKYGSARLYWSCNLKDEVRLKKIQSLIRQAEKFTESTCMVCSAPAEIKKYGGWFACLCDVHGHERIQNNCAFKQREDNSKT